MSDLIDVIPSGISSAGRRLPDADEIHMEIVKAKGQYVWDTSGKQYIDYLGAMGVSAFGHADDTVIKAVKKVLDAGILMTGINNPLENKAMSSILEHAAGFTWGYFLNSGSEATTAACNMARSITHRRLIVKIEGGYNGWFSGLTLGNVGSSQSVFSSDRRPEYNDVTIVRMNDLEDAKLLFAEKGDEIAGVIAEPLFANAGCVEAADGYLEALCDLAHEYSSIFICDQVLMGFRYSSQLMDISPGLKADLITLGKAIGGGVPVAAVIGREKMREMLASSGYIQHGTYNGNALAAAAVIASMKLATPDAFLDMHTTAKSLCMGLTDVFSKHSMPISFTGRGGVLGWWIAEKAPSNLSEAVRVERHGLRAAAYKYLRKRGILIMPWDFSRIFISSAHNSEDVLYTVNAFNKLLDSEVLQRNEYSTNSPGKQQLPSLSTLQ